MSNKICHPYHIVDESLWPLLGAIRGLYFTTGIVSWFHLNDIFLFIFFNVGFYLFIEILCCDWWPSPLPPCPCLFSYTPIIIYMYIILEVVRIYNSYRLNVFYQINSIIFLDKFVILIIFISLGGIPSMPGLLKKTTILRSLYLNELIRNKFNKIILK